MSALRLENNRILPFLPIFVTLTFLIILADPVLTKGTDQFLRLMDGHHIEDIRKKQMWTKEKSRIFRSADEAQHFLTQLNRGDFGDWRFPTKHELHDLLLIFDMKNNGEVKVPIEGKYWLMGEDGKVSAGAWEFGGGCGPARHFHSGERGRVWAVRP